ncbi:MAG: HD domain-containing protein [Clostridiales bacterium]|jgi:HD superfamily phosphodiesterase|nr:HD domain-containing protein [Clostridiales bacterium]
MNKLAELIEAMSRYESGVPSRVGHFLKVYGYAKTIGELEGLPSDIQAVLEAAAIVHDIGIKPSVEKYGSSAGKHQEQEGPPAARDLLEQLGFEAALIERVCFLVGHHHTYAGVDGLDYQILLEADFLVNMLEEAMTVPAIQSAYDNVFKSETGRRLCRHQYLPAPINASPQ